MNSSGVVIWEDPPEDTFPRRKRDVWVPFVAELKSNPGRWGRFRVQGWPSPAWTLAWLRQTFPRCEFTYGRWVGLK